MKKYQLFKNGRFQRTVEAPSKMHALLQAASTHTDGFFMFFDPEELLQWEARHEDVVYDFGYMELIQNPETILLN